jgi:hypothetical protein
MAVNVFEGARRIALVAGALWAVGVVGVVASQDSRINVFYLVVDPDTQALRIEDRECGVHDRSEYLTRTTSTGTEVRIQLCFAAQAFPGGKMLIPTRSDGKMLWGSDWLSTEARDYTSRRAAEFAFHTVDQKWADSQRWPERWSKAKTAIQWIAGGLIALWIFAFTVGWIVRGFAGIPHGKDSKSQ